MLWRVRLDQRGRGGARHFHGLRRRWPAARAGATGGRIGLASTGGVPLTGSLVRLDGASRTEKCSAGAVLQRLVRAGGPHVIVHPARVLHDLDPGICVEGAVVMDTDEEGRSRRDWLGGNASGERLGLRRGRRRG